MKSENNGCWITWYIALNYMPIFSKFLAFLVNFFILLHELWYYKSIETIENACFQNACLIFIRSFQMSFNFFHTLHLHLVIFLSFVISVNWWTIFCFVTTWWEISIIQKSIDKWLEQPLLDLRLQHAIMYMMIID